jgi:hypothetical protein
MTAICPECGHEFNEARVSSTVKDFTLQINEYDADITEEINKLHKSKDSMGMLGWVALNMFTFAIPFVFRTIKRFLFPTHRDLTLTEQKKKSYIENFVVPANREDIMEFVMFAGNRVENLTGSSGPAGQEIAIILMWAKVWADKCRQLISRAGVALAGDTKTMSVITEMTERPQKMLAQARKREFIKAGVFAGVLVVAVALIIVSASGVGVKVPDTASIAAENVTITGPLEDYFKAAGDGFTVRSREGGTEISISVEIEAVKDTMPFIEKQIADAIKRKGWQEDKCTFKLVSFQSDVRLVDFSNISNEEEFLSSILKIEPGTTKKIAISVSLSGFPGSRKKTVAKWMAMENIELYIVPGYQIESEESRSREYLSIK